MSYTGVYEEPWNERIEHYFKNVQREASFHSKLNNESGYSCRDKRIRWGLPAVLIPLVMSSIVVMVEKYNDEDCINNTNSTYVGCISLILTGIFTGVSNFFDYGTKSAKHYAVALLYNMIVDEIKLELTKGRKFRLQADVFMTKISLLMSSAAREEPVIPPSVLKNNETSRQELNRRRDELSDEMSNISTPPSKTSSDIITTFHTDQGNPHIIP